MEHLSIYFRHGIRDIIPFCHFVKKVRLEIEDKGLGQYLYDDMAIDGGDAEAIFSCQDSKALFDFLAFDLSKLSFISGARVRCIHGGLDSDAPFDEFFFEFSSSEIGSPNEQA
jgi:hypothetical protein